MKKIIKKSLLLIVSVLTMMPGLLTIAIAAQSNRNTVLAQATVVHTLANCNNGAIAAFPKTPSSISESESFCSSKGGLAGTKDYRGTVEEVECRDGGTYFTMPGLSEEILTKICGAEGRPLEDEANKEACYDDTGGEYAHVTGTPIDIPKQPLKWFICGVGWALAEAVDGINRITMRLLLFDPTQTQAEAENIYRPSCTASTNDNNCASTAGIAYTGVNSLKQAWGNVLTLANIILVIAFLIMVIATALDTGLVSNYTVKKLLPRIILAAIGANLSWGIASIIIQLVNFIGIGIGDFLVAPFSANLQNSLNTVGDAFQINGGLGNPANAGIGALLVYAVVGLAVIVVASGGTILLPILAIVLTVVGIAFLVILARRIILTILILLAPAAFIMWALPGGEGLFKKWWKTFNQMTLFFPITMVLFSVGIIIASVASDIGVGLTGQDSNISKLSTAIVMLVSIVAPYAMIPFALKFSSGILGKVGGIMDNKSKGLIDRSKNAYNTSGYKLSKQGAKDAKLNVRKQDATAEGVERRLNRRTPGGFMYRKGLDRDQRARLGASAENAQTNSIIEGHLRRGTPTSTLAAIASGSQRASEAERKAALITLAKQGRGRELTQIQRAMAASGDTKGGQIYDRALRENGGDFKDAGAATTVSLFDGDGNMRTVNDLQTEQANKYLSMSTEELATMSAGQWRMFHEASAAAARHRHAAIDAAAQGDPAAGIPPDVELARKFKFNAAETARVNPDGTRAHDWW